jgi:tetratricopeptide (TPR) repeat protein
MGKSDAEIKAAEDQVEKALWDLEVHDKLEEALDVYTQAEGKLTGLAIQPTDPDFPEQQRVLSYCLMRQGNILRQLGKPHEALLLGEREISAARLSGDEITLARALMSNGTNYLVAGEVDKGLQMLEEGRQLFENGDSFDHRQGLGWYWILQADLSNAGLVKKAPGEVIEIASRALSILQPLQNWPGVARAYAARAKAHASLGQEEAAERDRENQKLSEAKIEPGETGE